MSKTISLKGWKFIINDNEKNSLHKIMSKMIKNVVHMLFTKNYCVTIYLEVGTSTRNVIFL